MTLRVSSVIAMLAALMVSTTKPASGAASEATVLRMLKSPVAGDKTLAALVGKWRGRGTVRQNAASTPEATQCRITNTWAAKQRLARLQLSCRGTEIWFTANGYLGRSNRDYLGAWSTSNGASAVMSGRRSGSGLRLNLTARAAAGGAPRTSILDLRIAGKAITLKLSARDSKTGKVFTQFETTVKR